MQNNTIIADRVNVQSSFQNNSAPIEDIIAIAKQIWKKVTIKKAETEAETDKLLNEIQDEFKEFFQSFPLVLRWMVQLKQFKLSVFKKYLHKVSITAVSNREEYLDLQAEYLVMLYKSLNSHIEEHKIQNYRKHIIDSLLEEDKMFKEIQKEVENQMKKEENELNEERKKLIYSMLMKKKLADENK